MGLVKVIGVRELRQHASRHLARVEAGEELGITNNGRLVGRLVPVQAGERSRDLLIESGLLIPARQPQNLFDITPVPVREGKDGLNFVTCATSNDLSRHLDADEVTCRRA